MNPVAAIAFFVCSCAAASVALGADGPRSSRPGDRLAPPSLPSGEGETALRLRTGAAGGGDAGPPLLSDIALSMTLNLIEVVERDGAGLAATPGFAEAAEAARGRTVGFEEIEDLRRRLTETLVDAGYLSSGLRLVEIDLDRGAVRFEIVAGRLAEIRVRGEGVSPIGSPHRPGEIDAAYIRERMVGDGGVFSLPETEERLRILIRDRNIDRIAAAVRPGAAPGDAVLDIEAEARRPYDLIATLANDTPDGVGEETLTLTGAARNLAFSGDELRAEIKLSEGRRAIALEAGAPLWPGGPSPFVAFEHAVVDFVAPPFSTLDVDSRFTRFGAGMRIPLIETSAQRLTTVLGLDLKRTRSSLLDEPFSFSAGVQDGETNVTVLSIAQEFVDLRETRTLALRAAANFGLPIFNATENPSPAPDGGFVSFIGQGQVAQRLASGLTLVGRVQGQIATKPLLPVEQVAVGGRDTVRGYGESALIGDEAIVGSVEARIALFDGAAPGITPPGHDATVAIAPFVDAGGVFLKSGGSDLLVGAGAGLLWSPRPGVDVSLYAAAALTSRELRGGGAQGEGVHFAVSFGLP